MLLLLMYLSIFIGGISVGLSETWFSTNEQFLLLSFTSIRICWVFTQAIHVYFVLWRTLFFYDSHSWCVRILFWKSRINTISTLNHLMREVCFSFQLCRTYMICFPFFLLIDFNININLVKISISHHHQYLNMPILKSNIVGANLYTDFATIFLMFLLYSNSIMINEQHNLIHIQFKFDFAKRFEMAQITQGDLRGNGRWTKQEHEKFLLGLQLYGKNWKKIQQVIGTRTGSQIRSHAQKYFLKNKELTEDHSEQQGKQESLLCPDSMTVIKNNFSKKMDSLEGYSCYMKQIIKMTLELENFNFWDQLIDISASKAENQFIGQVQIVRKDSFVTFDLCNDSKQETESPCLSIIG